MLLVVLLVFYIIAVCLLYYRYKFRSVIVKTTFAFLGLYFILQWITLPTSIQLINETEPVFNFIPFRNFVLAVQQNVTFEYISSKLLLWASAVFIGCAFPLAAKEKGIWKSRFLIGLSIPGIISIGCALAFFVFDYYIKEIDITDILIFIILFWSGVIGHTLVKWHWFGKEADYIKYVF